MKVWQKNCKEFKNVRELINNGDNRGVMQALFDICDKYANESDEWAEDWAYEFEKLRDEIEESGIEDADEETANFYLNELYDLCDDARVWLEF